MPHPKKKQRLTGDDANLAEAAAGHQMTVSAGDLSVDVLANILGFLGGAKDIMQRRRVCKKWKEAVKITIVPLNTDVFIDDMGMYNAMNVMSTEMPNLQQITLGLLLGRRQKYNDGEDPNEEEAARTADWTTLNINIISNFSKLRELYIDGAPLNGRYPFLFRSFPLLQKLYIRGCSCLKWDLDMLAACPLLKEFDSEHNYGLTGNISSLRVLKDTLEKVRIVFWPRVEGNFMDVADFSRLKILDLEETDVTGDIRDIGDNNFSLLECLDLPKGVYGGHSYELQRISDAPDLVRAVYLFNKQRPTLKMKGRWYATLSEDSPDRYDSVDDGETPPFFIGFVKAGSRVGYRWETNIERPCEINWLDPEPATGSSDYEKYAEELQKIEGEVPMYRGLHEPPTEEEYLRLWGE